MSDDDGLKRHGWRRGNDRRERRASLSSLNPSPYLSSKYSPRISSPGRSKVSPRPARNRRRSTWSLPGFLRRKLDRNSDRVGSIIPQDSPGGIAISSQAFEDPYSHKNPYLSSFQESPKIRFSSSYSEPQVHNSGGFREAKYLDLFEPGVQVVRDPKLDQPQRTWKERLRPIFSSNFGAVAPTKFVIGCFVVLITLIIGIVAIVSVARLLSIPPDDPRISYPFVTTATSCGLVKGIVEKDGYVFRGVPYALPPVQTLRLRPAQVHHSLDHCWANNYTANISRHCWSYDYQGAIVPGFEDCLLLDVFTPKLGYENPLPVVIYIGGASLGSDSRRSNLLKRALEMAVQKHVVIVSPQIRRGLLGFMPSPELAASTYPHTSGNQGASDFMASLKWVNNNIEHFGGNKDKVTILGHQAGAALVWPMLKRAHAKKLIHSAWLTGAAPVHPRNMWRNAPTQVARPLNCSSSDCILRNSANYIMDAAPVDWRRHNGRPWLVGDGVFIPIEEEIPQVPIMFGSTEQSAAEYLFSWRNRLTSAQTLEEAVFTTLQELQYFNPLPLEKPREIKRPTKRFPRVALNEVSNLLNQYGSLSSSPWLQLTTLISDATTVCPTIDRAKSLARKWDHSVPTSREFMPPVFAYLSKHRRTSTMGGVADGMSDIEAILGVFRPLTRSDSSFMLTMQNLFYTFVETGAPLRYLATPAHHGIYVINDSFKIVKERDWCQRWENKSNFVRYF